MAGHLAVGDGVGTRDGGSVGRDVGALVGTPDGASVGWDVGVDVGTVDGTPEGCQDCHVGSAVGTLVGSGDGGVVGTALVTVRRLGSTRIRQPRSDGRSNVAVGHHVARQHAPLLKALD